MLKPAVSDGLPIEERPVVLFDFDGTLANTQPAIMRVLGEVLARRGMTLTHEQMMPLIGPPLEVGIRLVTDMDERDAAQVAAEYRELFERTVTAREVPLFPHVLDLIDALAADGRRIGVATSRVERSTIELIDMLDLKRLDVVAGRVPGVRESKAESIAAALEALDATPEEAVMVGDRKYDVTGAAQLGIPCIGVYSGAAEPGEHEDAGACAACADMFEVGRVLGVW